jgi:hypothetical protein
MSMNLFLQNNDNLLPRDQVRVERVEAVPFPDRRRVKLAIDVTPFRERPNLELTIRDADGKIVAGTSVIATMHFKMEFNLHLRGVDDPTGAYTVQVQLYYDDVRSPQDVGEANLVIPPANGA